MTDLIKLGVPMSKINTIMTEAADAAGHLSSKLGADAASVALAVALGKLCAESGISLLDAIALVEISHREALPETELPCGTQVAA